MDCNTSLAWFGFWIFLAVFVICDHWIYSKGYNSFFNTHKTAAEQELQQLKIEELKLKIQLHKQNKGD